MPLFGAPLRKTVVTLDHQPLTRAGIADVERRIMLEASRPADVSLPRNGATPNLRQFSQGNYFGTGFRGLPHLQTTPAHIRNIS